MAFLDETGLAELWSLVKAEGAKAPKVAVGSYIGTGTYGANNPNSLTFDFAPAFVYIYASKNTYTGISHHLDASYNYALPVGKLSTGYQKYFGFGYKTSGYNYGKRSADGKTVYWYTANTDAASAPGWQLNYADYEYFYIAIG